MWCPPPVSWALEPVAVAMLPPICRVPPPPIPSPRARPEGGRAPPTAASPQSAVLGVLDSSREGGNNYSNRRAAETTIHPPFGAGAGPSHRGRAGPFHAPILWHIPEESWALVGRPLCGELTELPHLTNVTPRSLGGMSDRVLWPTKLQPWVSSRPGAVLARCV